LGPFVAANAYDGLPEDGTGSQDPHTRFAGRAAARLSARQERVRDIVMKLERIDDVRILVDRLKAED
jgi:hypothetical protein